MALVQRARTAYKALRQLGLGQVGPYAVYQLGLRSGLLRRQTPPAVPPEPAGALDRPADPPLPGREQLCALLGPHGLAALLAEAGEIAAGQVRLFGGPPVPLQLAPPGPLPHWTEYELGRASPGEGDIKWIWEPGRFGWAYILARAYRAAGDERHAAAFWEHTTRFLESNPPNRGPHWLSAQEVALRLMAFSFALPVFAASPHTTPERQARLLAAIAAHARRIPPSLAYARAQNNNHLLTEAAGLFTAASVLPAHPMAPRWRALGWRWFNQGILDQVAPDGSYAQNSANYHRLMLHAALWVRRLVHPDDFPPPVRRRLAAATRWLLALLDSASGRVPNLGPNDGALILPLAACPPSDYRPALQAAAVAFLGRPAFPPGPWDEPGLWLQAVAPTAPVDTAALTSPDSAAPPSDLTPPHVLRNPQHASWAYLRAAHFTGRPGHADQLHLDLWWRGLNVAQDAGTYLYNAPPPWDNALARTGVHNTLTVAGQEQMTRAGRFLYLDWAQAEVTAYERAAGGAGERLTARHDGYRRLGVWHERTVEWQGAAWLVTDRLLPVPASPAPSAALDAILHWLLPDWPWELAGSTLRVRSPHGWVSLVIQPGAGCQLTALQLVRGGEILSGPGPVEPTWGEAALTCGWAAPTYGYKTPALALRAALRGPLPLAVASRWEFPDRT